MNGARFLGLLGLGALGLFGCGRSGGHEATAEPAASGAGAKEDKVEPPKEVELLNVSYDPTRELWRELNEKFVASYEKTSGTKIKIKQSHGGSSSQARSVIDGLEAHVVTLATYVDTDAIRSKGQLIEPGHRGGVCR